MTPETRAMQAGLDAVEKAMFGEAREQTKDHPFVAKVRQQAYQDDVNGGLVDDAADLLEASLRACRLALNNIGEPLRFQSSQDTMQALHKVLIDADKLGD